MVKTPRIRYLLPWMKLVALLRRLDEFCYLTSTLDIQRSRVVFCIAVELRRRHVVLIKNMLVHRQVPGTEGTVSRITQFFVQK